MAGFCALDYSPPYYHTIKAVESTCRDPVERGRRKGLDGAREREREAKVRFRYNYNNNSKLVVLRRQSVDRKIHCQWGEAPSLPKLAAQPRMAHRTAGLRWGCIRRRARLLRKYALSSRLLTSFGLFLVNFASLGFACFG